MKDNFIFYEENKKIGLKWSPSGDETLEYFYSPLVAPQHLRNDV